MGPYSRGRALLSALKGASLKRGKGPDGAEQSSFRALEDVSALKGASLKRGRQGFLSDDVFLYFVKTGHQEGPQSPK